MRKFMIALAVILMTGCSDNPVAPEVSFGACVVTAQLHQSNVGPNELQTSFGLKTVNPNAFMLGQDQLILEHTNGTRSFVLDRGDKVNVVIGPNGAGGIESNGKDRPIFRYLSSWQVVEERGGGIRYDDSSEIYFLTTGWQMDSEKNFTAQLTQTVSHQTVRKGEMAADTLPSNPNQVRFVYPFQLKTLECVGSGEITLDAPTGISTPITNGGRWHDSKEVTLHHTRRLTITATAYESALAARRAIAGMQIQP